MDKEALRFQAVDADRLLQWLALQPDQKLLDIYAGSGILALSAAQALTAGGHVTALGSAETLLEKPEGKIRQFSIGNIERVRGAINARHLAEIERHLTGDGLPLQVMVWQVDARKS